MVVMSFWRLAAYTKQMETPLLCLSTNCAICEQVIQYELVASGEDRNQGHLLAKVNVASFPL